MGEVKKSIRAARWTMPPEAYYLLGALSGMPPDYVAELLCHALKALGATQDGAAGPYRSRDIALPGDYRLHFDNERQEWEVVCE